MNYKKIADIVAVFHLFWTTVMVLTAILTYFFSWAILIIKVVLITNNIAQIIWLGNCPLTILENNLRLKYDPKIELKDSFIGHFFLVKYGIHIPRPIIFILLIFVTIVIFFLL